MYYFKYFLRMLEKSKLSPVYNIDILTIILEVQGNRGSGLLLIYMNSG